MTDIAMEHKQALQTKAVERYLLNEMAAAERDSFEEHYFGCRECAAELVLAAKFMDNAKPVLMAGADTVREGSVRPAAGSAWRWPDWVGAFISRPVLAGACAAMVLFIGVREVTYQPGAEVTASYFLAATRTDPKVITLVKGQTKVAIRLERTRVDVTEYEFSMPESKRFAPVRYTAASGVEEMQLTAPVTAFQEGRNVLLVKNAADGAVIAEVVFEVKFQ